MSRRKPNSKHKRRPDAWEKSARLSDDEQRQVFVWARDLGARRACELVKEQFKKTPPAPDKMNDFYAYFAALESEQRIRQAIVDSQACRDLAKQAGDSDALCDVLQVQAEAALLSRDPEQIKLLVGLALDARRSRDSSKTVQLAVEKFQFDAAKTALASLTELRHIQNDRGLSDTDKVAAARKALFGEVPA
jgi:hypothetical protein